LKEKIYIGIGNLLYSLGPEDMIKLDTAADCDIIGY